MPASSFSGLLVVSVIAFAMPLLLGFAPGVRVPSIVVEIIAGIIVGPSLLGWVHVDEPIRVLSLLGLAFVLLLGGMEIDFAHLSGGLLRLASLGFVVSFALALGVGVALRAAGLGPTPLLLALMLSATSLGVVIPVLKDGGAITSDFGQVVITAASIADFVTVLLLSLLFSGQTTSIGTRLFLLGGFAALVAAIALTLAGVAHTMRLSPVLQRLQDTTAQIRVRGAFLLLATFAALAEGLGLEVILGAFIAGAILRLIDQDRMMLHAQFRLKLEAIGFSVFIPFFFISSGLKFNLHALVGSPSAIARVPVFLAALLLVRGLPALLYRPLIGGRPALAAGLLQATSLGFIVVASQIGMELGKIDQATGAALVAAGMLSVLLFPLAALSVSRGRRPAALPREAREFVGMATEA